MNQLIFLYKKINKKMKRISKKINFSLESKNKERLANVIQEFIGTVVGAETKEEFLQKAANFVESNTTGENSTKQAIVKGTYQKLTFTKDELEETLKKPIENKIEILNPKEIIDIRGLFERITLERFAASSENIKKIQWQCETPSVLKMKMVDVKILLENDTWISLDIKAGNILGNEHYVMRNILGELCQTINCNSYTITNTEALSLTQIQNIRLNSWESKYNNLNIEYHSREDKIKLQDLYLQCKTINMSQETDIIKNIQIQDKIFEFLSCNKSIKLNSSFYYVNLINETSTLHVRFHQCLLPHINNDIFNNKKEFVKFMSEAIKIYHEEIDTKLLPRLQRTKSFWENMGFDEIFDAAFKR